MSNPSDHGKRPRWPLILGAVTLIYVAGYFAGYHHTVLGLQPVLDGKEILHLSRAIAEGTLPREPFYRAPLYSAVLALLLKLGIPSASLLLAARLFNGLCHIGSTLLVYATARRLWERREAGWLSGLLYGLYPVAVYFAGDPMDITLAITLLLAGLYFATGHLVSPREERRGAHAAAAGFFWALGALARPHVLPLALTWPFVAWARGGRTGWRGAAAAAAPAVAVFVVFGAANWRLSGDFRVMPLQGAYDFYAANRVGAHGKYLSLSVDLHQADDEANPARLESEILYRRETGRPPAPYGDVAAFWRDRALRRIVEEPGSWLRQMAWKAYCLLNVFEQYNNKTYAVHRDRSPWLRWNPVNWTVALVAGAGGLVIGWRRSPVRWVGLLALAYAAGVLLFYVSDRFRLPLVPMLAVLAGGWLGGDARPWPRIGAAALLLSAVSLSSFGHVADRRTCAEDYILMSRAAARLGRDAESEAHALKALEFDPDRPAAQLLLVLARYNLLLAALPGEPPEADPEEEYRRAAGLNDYDDRAAYVAGVRAWRLGRPGDATAMWRRTAAKGGPSGQDALAALLLTGRLNEEDRTVLRAVPAGERSTALLLAMAATGDVPARRQLAEILSDEAVDAQTGMLRALFQGGSKP